MKKGGAWVVRVKEWEHSGKQGGSVGSKEIKGRGNAREEQAKGGGWAVRGRETKEGKAVSHLIKGESGKGGAWAVPAEG